MKKTWITPEVEELVIAATANGMDKSDDFDGDWEQINGKWYADVTLPTGEALVKKILGLGAGVTVLSPVSLKEQVAKAAEKIAKAYF